MAGDEDEFLTQHEVVRRLGIGASTLRRLVKSGDFPGPIKIGTRRVAWLASEFEAWVAERKAARGAVG